MGLGYPQGEAENIYNKIPKRITANYGYFIKKWAEPRGYTQEKIRVNTRLFSQVIRLGVISELLLRRVRREIC